jgi:kynureninase
MDGLARWRDEFPILETCTYLVSHSLGAMPKRARRYLQEYGDTWATRGVRAWGERWWELGTEVGDLLAPILGAPLGSISMHQNVTVAQAIVASCHRFDGGRRKVVLTDLEFPSNIYLYEGFRRYGAQIEYVRCPDPVRVDTERLLEAIDDRTLLVPLSLVLFKSGCLQDAEAVIEKAHRVGARVVLDVYQAAGAVPIGLEALQADFAVGGSVKWLCGGPGAGYLYVRPDLAPQLEPGVTGWAAHVEPFAFEAGPTRYAPAPRRFQTGTPNVPGLYAARAGFEIVGEVGVEAIRAHSLVLTRRIIQAAEARGYRLHTPVHDRERGGTVTIDMPNGSAVADELIRRGVIVDYRPGAGIRMAPHFYNTQADVDRALAVLADVVDAVAVAT